MLCNSVSWDRKESKKLIIHEMMRVRGVQAFWESPVLKPRVSLIIRYYSM